MVHHFCLAFSFFLLSSEIGLSFEMGLSSKMLFPPKKESPPRLSFKWGFPLTKLSSEMGLFLYNGVVVRNEVVLQYRVILCNGVVL